MLTDARKVDVGIGGMDRKEGEVSWHWAKVFIPRATRARDARYPDYFTLTNYEIINDAESSRLDSVERIGWRPQ